MDEARFGLKVTHRRLWCPFGSRPPWTHDHQYHWFWLYAAVEPVSGTCVVLFLPHVDGVCFQRFLEELRQHTGSDTIGLVLDNSGSHASGKVHWPDGIEKIALPPYSPELNPAGSRRCAGSSPTRSSTPWKTSKPLLYAFRLNALIIVARDPRRYMIRDQSNLAESVLPKLSGPIGRT